MNEPIYGCAGCQTTAGAGACPVHGKTERLYPLHPTPESKTPLTDAMRRILELKDQEIACLKLEADDLRHGLAQAKQYIAHDTIAHAMRKKEDGEYELRFDPGCRRCGLDNLLVIYPASTEKKCCDSETIVKVRHEADCPVEGQADDRGFPTKQQMKIFRAVDAFNGACKAHRMTDCRICAEKQAQEPS